MGMMRSDTNFIRYTLPLIVRTLKLHSNVHIVIHKIKHYRSLERMKPMIFIIRAIAHKYGYLKFKSTPRAKNVN